MIKRTNLTSLYCYKSMNGSIEVGQDSLDLEEIQMTLQNCFLSAGRLYGGRTETFSKCWIRGLDTCFRMESIYAKCHNLPGSLTKAWMNNSNTWFLSLIPLCSVHCLSAPVPSKKHLEKQSICNLLIQVKAELVSDWKENYHSFVSL